MFVALLTAIDFWQRRNLVETGEKVDYSSLNLQPLDSERTKSLVVGKRTLIYFFAPWCVVCKYSMPALNSLSEQNNLQVLLIALDYSDRSSVQAFVNDNSVKVQTYLGGSELRDRFQIESYPTLYFIGSNGEVGSSKVGYTPSWLIRLKLLFIS